MRTFEFIEGSSKKFWNIELDGNKTIVTFGRIGTKGQTKTKEHASAAAAQKEYDKLIKEKLGKGYTETTAEAEEESVPAAPALTGRAAKLKESLEAALLENPDDLATHSAYADLLSENGDPRGELIQVQLALEDEKLPAKKRKQLQDREQELFDAHGPAWYGALAKPIPSGDEAEEEESDPVFAYRWRRGWIDALTMKRLSSRAVQAFTQSPLLLLLRELVIPYCDWNEEDPPLLPLGESPYVQNLRVFQLGPDGDSCHISGPDLHLLVPHLPRLEELKLFAHRIEVEELFKLKMPNLRVLYVHHLHGYPLEILARNKSLTKLETLSFWPHGLEPGDEAAYITAASFIALVRSPHLRGLRHLEVFNSDLGDEGCQAIMESGILKRLKVLDISRGRVTDEGARTLAECPDFANLERFGIAQNALGEEGIEALQATGVEILADNQYDQAQIDELGYLWEGDPE
jgi:uncharacterized protein (TIGR02996 family)